MPVGPRSLRIGESVSLPAIVDVGHHDAVGLIETEKDTPLADAQAIPAFQRTFQRLDVAVTACRKCFQGADNTFRIRTGPCD